MGDISDFKQLPRYLILETMGEKSITTKQEALKQIKSKGGYKLQFVNSNILDADIINAAFESDSFSIQFMNEESTSLLDPEKIIDKIKANPELITVLPLHLVEIAEQYKIEEVEQKEEKTTKLSKPKEIHLAKSNYLGLTINNHQYVYKEKELRELFNIPVQFKKIDLYNIRIDGDKITYSYLNEKNKLVISKPDTIQREDIDKIQNFLKDRGALHNNKSQETNTTLGPK